MPDQRTLATDFLRLDNDPRLYSHEVPEWLATKWRAALAAFVSTVELPGGHGSYYSKARVLAEQVASGPEGDTDE